MAEDSRIGSIAVGKQADLMIVKGNPAAKITDLENVEIVFKDGLGYDSEKLIQSVQGWLGYGDRRRGLLNFRLYVPDLCDTMRA